MPEWNEDALILSVRPHGESSALLSWSSLSDRGGMRGLSAAATPPGFAARSSLAILSGHHGARDFPNSLAR